MDVDDRELLDLAKIMTYLLTLDNFTIKDRDVTFACSTTICVLITSMFAVECKTITVKDGKLYMKDVYENSLIFQGLNRDEPSFPPELWTMIEELNGTEIETDVDTINLDELP